MSMSGVATVQRDTNSRMERSSLLANIYLAFLLRPFRRSSNAMSTFACKNYFSYFMTEIKAEIRRIGLRQKFIEIVLWHGSIVMPPGKAEPINTIATLRVSAACQSHQSMLYLVDTSFVLNVSSPTDNNAVRLKLRCMVALWKVRLSADTNHGECI